MVMQKIRSSKSSALTVKVGTATACSPMQIEWDASTGKAPWTVMIAPINEAPFTVSIPDVSGSTGQYNWSVPKFTSSTAAFIAVSDSSGDVSGVSSQVTIGTSSSSCTAPDENLDFIWYPTASSDLPSQCSDWSITWQEDTGNSGVEGKVSFTFLPEQGIPITVSTGDKTSTGSFDFTVPWDSGTKFAAIANDGGKTGSGGVGDLYVVTAGKSTSCSANASSGNGLPSAQTTASVASSTSTSTSTKKGSSTQSTAGSMSVPEFTQGSSAANGTSSSKSSTVGAAVGGTFAALAVIALLVGFLFYWRKRSRSQQAENPFEKEPDQHGISPWRFSSSPYAAPVTTSRTSKWLDKASNIAPAMGFRSLGDRSGHTASNSMTTSHQGRFTSAHTRGASSVSKSASDTLSSPTSPQQGPTSFRNIVPDHALFPPPKPGLYEDRYFNGSGSSEGANVDSMPRQDFSSQYASPPQETVFAAPRRKPLGLAAQEEIAQSGRGYYNGPTSTNIYDSHTQAGRMWQDRDGLTHEVQLGMEQPVTSEVMMQDFLSSENRKSDRQSLDEGLPYL